MAEWRTGRSGWDHPLRSKQYSRRETEVAAGKSEVYGSVARNKGMEENRETVRLILIEPSLKRRRTEHLARMERA